MPVRIYDIAKRHGISSKDVIDKLIESGFAKSDQKLKPSSTIDKVTAEELEKLLPPVSLPGVQESSEHGHVVEGQTLTAEMPSVMEGAAPASGVSTGDTSVEAVATASAGISSVVASEKEVSEGAVESAVTTVEKEVGVEVPASGEGTSGEGINEVAVAGGVKGDSILEDVQEVSQEVEVGAVSEKSEGGAGVVVPTAGEVVGAQEGQEKVSEVKTEGAESVLNQGVAISESESVVEGGLESTVVEAVPGQETAEAEMEGKEREVEIEPVMQVKAQGEMSGVVVQPEEKPQVVQEPPSPPKPGIGDVVGRIDISKYLSKDKGREKEREKEKQKQKPQDQKKAVPVSGGKQQVQKPPQVAGKGQSMPGKPGQQPPKPQKPGQQQGKRQQVLEPVQLVKPQVSKDGRPVKMDKSAKLPPNAPVVMIKPPIVVRELAEKLGKKPFQVIAELVKRKIMANVNALVDEAVAKDIAAIFGINLVIEKRGAKPGPSKPEPKKPELEGEVDVKKLKPRPPVVTIMGHVDHGKTTLLDAIRKSNVVATEAGGITQHIGAYTIAIPHPDDKKKMMNITFLDTPGHAAFSAMRARGANVTDIVVLVVAADDGVMPQTVEALNHAKAANVPIIVAVNKCDHPNANPIRVREQLSKQGLTPEEWGGETIYVDVSALKKQGVDKLLEMIVLKAEMMELRADPDCPAKGFVVESALEAGGPAVTLLVKRGTLRVGDVVLCGQFFGKARALINEKNERQKEAGPSFAVKMLGLNGVPEPGQAFEVVEEQDKARELAESRAEEIKKQGQTAVARKVTLESLMEAIESNQVKVLKVVIKADTQGSVEAICGALKNIKSEKVSLEIIHDGVGPISESDVMLAAAAKGIVIGFHTKLEHGVSDIAKREGVQIKLYTIIYELIDEVKKAMAGLLEPIIKEVVTGKADVKKVFEISRGGKVAGCMVREGVMSRGRARVYRGRDLIYEGTMASLRHFQEEVNEIRAGMECGIRIEGFNDFQEGDVIECYNIEKALQELD